VMCYLRENITKNESKGTKEKECVLRNCSNEGKLAFFSEWISQHTVSTWSFI